LPRYIIHVSDGAKQERAINARDELEATESALTALSVHISRTFPPPSNVKIVVMDDKLNECATLRFSYEAPEEEAASRHVQ